MQHFLHVRIAGASYALGALRLASLWTRLPQCRPGLSLRGHPRSSPLSTGAQRKRQTPGCVNRFGDTVLKSKTYESGDVSRPSKAEVADNSRAAILQSGSARIIGDGFGRTPTQAHARARETGDPPIRHVSWLQNLSRRHRPSRRADTSCINLNISNSCCRSKSRHICAGEKLTFTRSEAGYPRD